MRPLELPYPPTLGFEAERKAAERAPLPVKENGTRWVGKNVRAGWLENLHHPPTLGGHRRHDGVTSLRGHACAG